MVLRFLFGLLSLAALAAPAHAADPSALWKIVHGRCVPDEQAHNDPAPCTAVDLAGGDAVLKDIVGATQFLLIPTQRTSGIESPAILASGCAGLLGRRLGRAPPGRGPRRACTAARCRVVRDQRRDRPHAEPVPYPYRLPAPGRSRHAAGQSGGHRAVLAPLAGWAGRPSLPRHARQRQARWRGSTRSAGCTPTRRPPRTWRTRRWWQSAPNFPTGRTASSCWPTTRTCCAATAAAARSCRTIAARRAHAVASKRRRDGGWLTYGL